MEINSESRWVAERLAKTEVEWAPRLGRGLALLDARRPQPKGMTAWAAVAVTAVALTLVAAFPGSRAIEQDLWYRVLMNRIAVVQIDLSRLALDTSISMNGNLSAVSNAQEAELKAGFRPYLPPVGAPLELQVIGPVAVRQTVRVRALEEALQRSGVTDVAVPLEWDGVVVRAEIGATVMAGYPGDVQLLQLRPIALQLPAGFPLARFAETAMRSVGMGWWEARVFGAQFARNPAWLIDVSPEDRIKLSEIPLHGGMGILAEDIDEHEKAERFTIIHGTQERLYLVSAPTREACLRMAMLLR